MSITTLTDTGLAELLPWRLADRTSKMAENLADRGTRVVLITGAAAGGADGSVGGHVAAEIAACLRERCGVAEQRIATVTIRGEHDREAVAQTLDREAGLTFGPLLIWYVGPASLDAAGGLCLGPGLAVPFADFATVLAARRAGWPTLAILDCPHSAQAQLTNPEWGLLTSTPPGAAGSLSAPFVSGLTGHLLRVLSEGIPGGPPELSLELAYRYVAQIMADGGQVPRLLCGRRIGALVLAPNPAADPRPGAAAGVASGAPGPGQRRIRLATVPLALSVGAAALAIALAVVLLYPRGSGPAASPTRSAGVTGQGTTFRTREPRLTATLTDPGAVWEVAFSPDGRTLATVSEGPGNGPGTVRLWNLASRKNTVTIASPSWSIAWNPDGQTLATSIVVNGSGIRLWDAVTGKVSAQFSTPLGEPDQPIAISPDGRTLATVLAGQGTNVSSPCTILLLNLPSGTPKATLTTDFDEVPALAFSPDGTMLAAAGQDMADTRYAGAPVSVWNLTTDQLVTTLHGPVHFSGLPDQDVRADSVAFSPDGRTIAAASDADGISARYTGVRLWNIAARTATTLTVTGGGALAFSPDGRILATANSDGADVQLWDTATGRLITTITFPSTPTGAEPFGTFSTLAFSPDGKTLAIPDGNTIQLWSVGTLPLATAPSTVTAPSSPSAAVSPADAPTASRAYPVLVDNAPAAGTGMGTVTEIGPTWYVSLRLQDPGPIAVAPNGRYAYVATTGGLAVISGVDTAHPKISATVSTDGTPGGIAITPGGTYAYITVNSANGSFVMAYSGASIGRLQLAATLRLELQGSAAIMADADTIAITPDGRYAYVAVDDDPYADTLTEIGGVANAHLKQIWNTNVGGNPEDVAVTPNGNYVYLVTNSGTSGIVRVFRNADTPNPAYVKQFAPPGNVGYVAVTPNGRWAYIQYVPGNILKITGPQTSPQQAGTATLRGGGLMVIQPGGQYALETTSNASSGAVLVLTGTSAGRPEITSTWKLPYFPYYIAISPVR
jgi:WD40 repeat protein